MTDRVLPALDEKLDEKISRMIDGLITETGGMIIQMVGRQFKVVRS